MFSWSEASKNRTVNNGRVFGRMIKLVMMKYVSLHVLVSLQYEPRFKFGVDPDNVNGVLSRKPGTLFCVLTR